MAQRVAATAKTKESKQKCSSSCKQKPSFNSSGSLAYRIMQLQRTAGNQAVQRLIKSGALQEEKILQTKPLADSITPLVQRQANGEEEEELNEETLMKKGTKETVHSFQATPLVHDVLQSPGQSLDNEIRAYFEPRFGCDFSNVRIHTDTKAAESARAVNAQAYTVGEDIVFGIGQYTLSTSKEKTLMAHELAHIVQQGKASMSRQSSLALSPIGQLNVQRTLGDGDDLISPRFSRLPDLEAAYDGGIVISIGHSSRGVQAIQQALYDLGYLLPGYGADGKFGSETKAAVKAFQREANPPLKDDGKVGMNTMSALDMRFGVPILPSSANLSAPWTSACVRSVLCPWSPHTIEVLKTRITLKSFDRISWADEMWDGRAWVPAPFPGVGYNTGSEIGVLNNSCEEISETLYHEVLHAEQPSTHRTTQQKEAYAYRIGEEFSITMGLGGRPDLRSTDSQGRQYADKTKVEAFVGAAYPSVPVGGGADEIIGKATSYGHVRVQRPDGTIYTRPAVAGEKVPGLKTTDNEVIHPTAGWICP